MEEKWDGCGGEDEGRNSAVNYAEVAGGHGGHNGAHASGAPTYKPERTVKVLVVDDDPAWRELGTEFAQQEGLEVLTASSAGEAIRALSGGLALGVDAILSDVSMPGLSGMELARVLRGEEVRGVKLDSASVKKLGSIPVVLHTSCSRHVDPSTHEGVKAAELVRRRVIQAIFEKGFPNPKIFEYLRRARRGV